MKPQQLFSRDDIKLGRVHLQNGQYTKLEINKPQMILNYDQCRQQHH